MKNVSNGVIVSLLLVAIVVSALSTVVSLGKLSQLRESLSLNVLTGAVSSTSETNLTITSTTALRLINTQINFGSGRVNGTCDYCGLDSDARATEYMSSNGSNWTRVGADASHCCLSFTVPSSGFLIENTGNTNVSVGYTCDGAGNNCTHAAFVGGTLVPNTLSGFGIRVSTAAGSGQAGEDGAADNQISCIGSGVQTVYNSSLGMGSAAGWNVTNGTIGGAVHNATQAFSGRGNATEVHIMPTGHWLCGNASTFPLSSANDRDAGVIDINITIPADAPSTPSGIGSHLLRLVFNATSSG